MLTLSVASLYAVMNQYFWPMLRVLALFTTAPIFNEQGIGKKAKIGLAIVISLLIGQHQPNTHIEIFSFAGLWVGAQQFIIGAAIGLTVQLFSWPCVMPGSLSGCKWDYPLPHFLTRRRGEICR